MVSSIKLFAGIGLLGLVIYDMVKTTVSVNGAGWLSRQYLRVVGTIDLATRRFPRRWSRPLRGPLLLMLTLIMWFGVVFLGWFLIFNSWPRAIVSSQGREAISTTNLIYFTGSLLVTLGIGDFVPITQNWRLASILASLHGFFSVTLAITYLLPLVSAVVTKQGLAASISHLGRSAEVIACRAYHRGSFDAFEGISWDIITQLNFVQRQHAAYPLLHEFQSASAREEMAVSLALITDVVALVTFGVAEDRRPSLLLVRAVREAVHEFVDTIQSPDKEPVVPPYPSLKALAAQDVPIGDASEFQEKMKELDRTRAKLNAIIQRHGFEWPKYHNDNA